MASSRSDRHAPRLGRGKEPLQQSNPAGSEVRGDDKSARTGAFRQTDRLAAGSRAEVEDPTPLRGAGELDYQLGCFLLQQEASLAGGRRRAQVALHDHESVRGELRRGGAHALRRENPLQLCRAVAREVRSQRDRRRGVVELRPGLGGRQAVAVEPPLDQPPRVGQRCRQVVERGPPPVHTTRVDSRCRGQVSRAPVVRQCPQDGVQEARRSPDARFARQLDGVGDRRMRRDSIQKQQLVGGRPQQVERGRRDGRERPGGGLPDEVVDRGPPALDTQDDLTDETAVARILEASSRTFQGRGQIGTPRMYGTEHVMRGPPGWRAHAAAVSKRWPADQR